VGELHFDEDADAALSELERHPGPLLDEVNRWLDRLEADHGDRELRSMAYLGGRFRIDVDNRMGDPWMILWKPHPDIRDDAIVHYLGPQFRQS
jgi:hypothetical protein